MSTPRPNASATLPAPRRSNAWLRRAVGMLGAGSVGFLLAVQSRINGALGVRLQDPVAAAMISFGGGLLVLLLVVALTPAARRGLGELARVLRSGHGLRPWQCAGGVCGAFLVFSQAVSTSVLGVALFTVAVVGGQITSGLVVDRLGLGPGGARHITAPRIIGAVLSLGAVGVAVSAGLGAASASWLVVLPAVAGIGIAWQQAMNGLVRETSGSAVSAATTNFAAGTVALLLAFAAELAVRGLPQDLPDAAWLYTGGLLGIFVIAGSTILVRYTGVLLLSMGIVSGQLLGALLLDLLVPTRGTEVAVSTFVGVGLTFVAVLVASVPAGAGRLSSVRSATMTNRERHDSRRQGHQGRDLR